LEGDLEKKEKFLGGGGKNKGVLWRWPASFREREKMAGSNNTRMAEQD
jgi:hypothetical protein